jgi:RimJ/RimL family protein N-acetyltransferase
VTEGGPADWVASHTNVRFRPIVEADLDLLDRLDTDPTLQPFEWRGFRDPRPRRRRWEEDSYLGRDDAAFVVALPDDTFAGFVSWRSSPGADPKVTYTLGIVLYPEFRGQGLGTSMQCLMADYLYSTTLANRVEAITGTYNHAEQRALEKAGFHREGVLRGLGFVRGQYGDGVMYSRLRSDPHP